LAGRKSGFRARVTDENIERTKFVFHLAEHAGDFLGMADIRLHDEAIRSERAHFGQSVFGRGLVAIVVDGDVYTAFG